MKISFLILIVLSTLSSGQVSIPVRDTNGNVLRSGTKYYIVPAKRGAGGGLITARGGGFWCPSEVAQEVSDELDGKPLSFVPANPNKDGIIYESTDLNIKFEDPHSCAPGSVWKVVVDNFVTPMVYNQGVLGNPGRETISNWFKIQKFEDHYKLVYCPSVCKSCKPKCADIGSAITNDRGRRSLVLNNIPFKVKFKKT
ncbi:miraculin-like [Rutidosis leptorrhynchoides]|uniref:miraculin-like n=1 Tax=Rutidosis leptorrhynchoides TaxID=125765 RepID=UPI003A9A1333